MKAIAIERWLIEQRDTGLLPADVERDAVFAMHSSRSLDQPAALQSVVLQELAAHDIARFERTLTILGETL